MIKNRNKAPTKPKPGDCNDIARKRKDSKSMPYSKQGEDNYDSINWNSKKKESK